jgi:Astacin (Peptidase family M12A)
MRGGRQQLNLQPSDIEVGCFRLGTVIHEYLHAVGFYHMQSATERDEYVRIVWENIRAGTENNFDKYSADVITNFDVGKLLM